MSLGFTHEGAEVSLVSYCGSSSAVKSHQILSRCCQLFNSAQAIPTPIAEDLDLGGHEVVGRHVS